MSGARPVGRFPSSRRLRKRREFQRVQSQGRRLSSPHFVFLLQRRAGEPPVPPCRLGITAAKRVGNAVVRNRAKRLVREAFRATGDLWRPGLDLVVIVKSSLTGLRLDDVIREWRSVEPALKRWTCEPPAPRPHPATKGRA